jgi:hypothetical protein
MGERCPRSTLMTVATFANLVSLTTYNIIFIHVHPWPSLGDFTLSLIACHQMRLWNLETHHQGLDGGPCKPSNWWALMMSRCFSTWGHSRDPLGLSPSKSPMAPLVPDSWTWSMGRTFPHRCGLIQHMENHYLQQMRNVGGPSYCAAQWGSKG